MTHIATGTALATTAEHMAACRVARALNRVIPTQLYSADITMAGLLQRAPDEAEMLLLLRDELLALRRRLPICICW